MMSGLPKNLIRPIVEFYYLNYGESARGATYEILDSNEKNRYTLGVKSALQNAKGIYVFYDSRGSALYVGKAVKQNLWKEVNSAYNRHRGQLQTIKRVEHPQIDIAYRPYEEKRRKIKDISLQLHEIASYVSAYEIAVVDLIPMFEAFLIRAFANNLLNKRVEDFSFERMAGEGGSFAS